MKERSRWQYFIRDVMTYPPLLKMGLWLLPFSTAIYFAEQQEAEQQIHSLAEALYWGVAAFSIAGIAEAPSNHSRC